MQKKSKKSSESMEDQSLPEGCDALKSFVMEQIEKQNNNSNDNISSERLEAFVNRALAESSRMNKQVKKSQLEMENLYKELGVRNMEDLTRERDAGNGI